VALQLKRQGITRVHPLKGGLARWMALGFPVADLPPREATAPTAPDDTLQAPESLYVSEPLRINETELPNLIRDSAGACDRPAGRSKVDGSLGSS
jgi:hypothetical protein